MFTLLYGILGNAFWFSVSHNNSEALHTTDSTHSCEHVCLSPFFAS